MAAGSGDRMAKAGQVKLWDVASGKELATLSDIRGFVTCLAISPDGKTLYAGYITMSEQPAEFKVWDLALRQARATVDTSRVHYNTMLDMKFFPDGKSLLTSGGRESRGRPWKATPAPFAPSPSPTTARQSPPAAMTKR